MTAPYSSRFLATLRAVGEGLRAFTHARPSSPMLARWFLAEALAVVPRGRPARELTDDEWALTQARHDAHCMPADVPLLPPRRVQ